MKLFIPIKQATLLIATPLKHNPNSMHLFIVLTNPQTEEKLVLIVNISTVRDGLHCDKTCILMAGDHDFIKDDSFVVYSRARVIESRQLMNGVNSNKMKYKGLIGLNVFNRICDGVSRSEHTPRKIKTFMKTSEPD